MKCVLVCVCEPSGVKAARGEICRSSILDNSSCRLFWNSKNQTIQCQWEKFNFFFFSFFLPNCITTFLSHNTCQTETEFSNTNWVSTLTRLALDVWNSGSRDNSLFEPKLNFSFFFFFNFYIFFSSFFLFMR